ncbi:hypothetical protein MKX03_025149 [Papaver bracteatum]|nr:hypothetical protein MKX03_025149 [Papaver bracteatum]
MGIRPAMNLNIPKFSLLMFYTIIIIKKLISFLVLSILGFLKYADSENTPSHAYPQAEPHHSAVTPANLVRKALPSVKFQELILTGKVNASDQDSCAICLCDYEGQDEIKPLISCHHVFHGSCLDRWIVGDQTTCPLCRNSLVPIQMYKASKESNLNVSSLEM